MLALLFAVCVAVLILFNPTREEEEVSPARNMGAWILAIICFGVLLSIVSVVGAGIAALAVVP